MEQNKLTLDVGCGDRPQGDVNVDCSIGETGELFFEGRSINPKKIKNFVLADAHHLPFIDNSFQKIVSYHTLEHLSNPEQALREFRRVSNGVVELAIPVTQHERFQELFVPKKRDYDQKHHESSFSYKSMRVLVPNGKIRFSYYIFHVLTNLKQLYLVTPHFFKFLFYSFGSTFFPPIPDVITIRFGD